MNNRTLEIILKLRDELTAKMKGAEGALKRFQAEASKFAKAMKSIGSSISQVGSSFLMMGAAITGPLAFAFNSAAKYSKPVSDEIERMRVVSDSFQLSLAQAMLPVMQQVTNILARLFQAWENLGKSTQQAIIQGALITGIFMTLGGVILKVIGGLVKTGGTIIQLMMRLSPVQIAVMLVVAAVALLIDNWEKCRAIVAPVLNTLEAGLSAVASGAATVVSLSVKPMAFLIGLYEKFVNLLAKIPGPQQQMFKTISAGLEQSRLALDKFSVSAQGVANNLAEHAVETWRGVDGVAVSAMDKLSANWKNIKSLFSDGSIINIEDLKTKLTEAEAWAERMKDVAQQTAQAMQSSMSTLFFDAFTNQLKSAKEYFADFGRAILQVLSQALAKMILLKTVGAAFPTLGRFFHTGGTVYAHSGMLARDEVPIVAQTGERILSRRENRDYERNILGRSSGSKDSGGPTIHITPVVTLMSASDVNRHKDAIISVINEAIAGNGALRQVIKRYA